MSNNTDDNYSYSPIQCQLYDYIEIACMRHYELEVTLIVGELITGRARTTLIKDKQEFLILDLKETKDTKEIRLDLIKSIKPLDEKAEFSVVFINK